uniref:Hpt domain-containing protein n=1 Tax=Sphaerotilus montanus TaxID=522889 RepID=UPI003FA29313
QCRDRAFRARRRTAPRVEVCSLDEATAGAVDGLWVIGMNEGAWPPAPRPNPILPAELQRRAGIPAARADCLADAARETQALWCASAAEVVFSWSQKEGERALRPSPLLAGLAVSRLEVSPPPVLVPGAIGGIYDIVLERILDAVLEHIYDAVLERIYDARAPEVGADERVRGGTGLLAGQAGWPAWAFHQYRAGAGVLPGRSPVVGAAAAPAAPPWPADGGPIVSRLADHPRLSRVVRTFGHTLPGKLAAMQSALDDGRLNDLADLAHWLKGAGGTVGFDVFFEPAREFERLARAGEPAELERVMRQIQALARRIVIPHGEAAPAATLA